MAGSSGLSLDIIARDLRIMELEAALQKSRSKTREIAISNGNLGRELKTQDAKILQMEQDERLQVNEIKTRADEVESLELEIQSQKEQIQQLTKEVDTKTVLLVAKECELEAEHAAQDGRIS